MGSQETRSVTVCKRSRATEVMSVLQDVLSKFPIWRSFSLIFQSFCKIGELRTIMLLAFGECVALLV